MGVCTSNNKNSAKNQSFTIPNSIHSQKLLTQGKLRFNIHLTSIKLRIHNLKSCKAKFKFGDFATFTSSLHISLQGNHNWEFSYTTTITTTEQDLKNINLQISILNQEDLEVGMACITLYEIATGPFLYKLTISSTKGFSGNISFEIKMPQIILISSKVKYLECELDDTLNHKAYSYSIRYLTKNAKFVSEQSSLYMNPEFVTNSPHRKKAQFSTYFTKYRQSQSLNSLDQPSEVKSILINQSPQQLNQNQQMIDQLHRLLWEKDEEEHVELNIEIPINELNSSSLELCVWAVQYKQMDQLSLKKINKDMIKSGKSQLSSLNSIDKKYYQIGEAYISFDQLIECQFENNAGKKSKYDQKIEKKLWNQGKTVGFFVGEFELMVPSYLEQMSIGMRTDKIIQLGPQLIDEGKSVKVQEIVQMSDIFQKMRQNVFKLQQSLKMPIAIKLKIRDEVQEQLKQLGNIFNQTHSHDLQTKTFQYKSQEDLLKAQDIIVLILQLLVVSSLKLNFIQQDYEGVLEIIGKQTYYTCLLLGVNRGELDLHQMGFFENSQELSKKQIQFKKQICFQYQTFLLKTLKRVLQKIGNKACLEEEKTFIQTFLAIAFFRVSQFRVKILKGLQERNDVEISEWRGTEYQLDEDVTLIKMESKHQLALFDWENYFYSYISCMEKTPQNDAILTSILSEEYWIQKFNKRGNVFFNFFHEWTNYVQSKFLKNHSPFWQILPGYITLAKAFLTEVKIQDMKQYTETLKQSIDSLILNEKLIQVLIIILFNKCNVYEPENVVITLEILNQCFSNLQAIPTLFDYKFFFKGIMTILQQSDHAYCLVKCLTLLYNNYLLFTMEMRKEISQLLLTPSSYKLFLHWSQNVRFVLQSFLIYRIYHQHKKNEANMTDEESIIQQYQVVSKPKKQQSFFESRDQQHDLISNFIYLKYTRFMSFIEQARQSMKQSNKVNYMAMKTLDKMKYKLQSRKENIMEKMELQDDKFSNLLNELDEDQYPSQSMFTLRSISKKGPQKFTNRGDQDVPVYQEQNSPISKKKKSRMSQITNYINEELLVYLTMSCNEWDNQMKTYKKWRQLKLQTILLTQKLTTEEKKNIHLKFEVPPVMLQMQFDLKEGRLMNEY